MRRTRACTRRSFLGLIALPLIGIPLAGCSRHGAEQDSGELTPDERAVVDALDKLLPDLDADAAFADFARAFVEDGRRLRSEAVDAIRLTTEFLLSTDFFQTGADVTRPLRYVTLYSTRIPCFNPFARFSD